MANKSKMKVSELEGTFIYHDPKYGTLWYDIFTKRAFQLVSSDIPHYQIYTGALPFSFVVAYFAYYWFKLNFGLCTLLGIGFYVIAILCARFFFFYKLPEVKNWQKIDKPNLIERLATTYTRPRLGILAFCFVGLSISMILLARMDAMTGFSLYAIYALSAICVVGFITVLIAIFRQNSNQ